MQDRFHEYVKWTWQLLGELETYHEDIGHIQEFLLAEGERVEGPRLRNLLFSVSPVASLTPHSLQFDTLGFEVRPPSSLILPFSIIGNTLWTLLESIQLATIA